MSLLSQCCELQSILSTARQTCGKDFVLAEMLRNADLHGQTQHKPTEELRKKLLIYSNGSDNYLNVNVICK